MTQSIRSSRARYGRQARVFMLACVCACACAVLPGCNLAGLVDNADTPSDIRDPKAVQNEAGALAMYRGTIDIFAFAVGGGANDIRDTTPVPTSLGTAYITISGLFTDELETLPAPAGGISGGLLGYADLRNFDRNDVMGDLGYQNLHIVRANSRETRGNIRQYGPRLPTALLSHLYALEGLSEVLLAELHCSGIPLSTVDYAFNVTKTRGFTTTEVYDHAIALFDSAIATAGDSTRFLHLARLGKARALLGKGDLAAAAQTVNGMPDTYRYELTYGVKRPKFIPAPTLLKQSDIEGVNGLPFISSHDPRTSQPGVMGRTTPLILGTGLEARLIQAEAHLIANDPQWLSTLNTLRTTCTLGNPCASPAPAGIGGIAGLPPLQDPATGKLTQTDSLNARIDLIFSERAFWFYLTGRRQGDLRRLVRYYARSQATVYPVGPWGTAGADEYGNAVVLPTPDDEVRRNSLYHGCEHFDA